MRSKPLFIITFLATSVLFAQAEMDLDNETPKPVLQQQTERMRDELAEKEGGTRPQNGQNRSQPSYHPGDIAPVNPSGDHIYQQKNRGIPYHPGDVIPINVESDTDTRIPDPILLQQRERILKEVAEKPNDPAFTAEVKAKWKNEYKRTDGFTTRGHNAVCPVTVPSSSPAAIAGTPITAPSNQYTSELNLYVDYETEWNWMEAKLQFKDLMGILSGTSNRISLQKAWIGYDAFDNCWGDLDAEIGRKSTSEIFDSRVQYDSTYDGILVTYTRRWERTGELRVHGGPCIVDAQTSHFAWIGELIWKEAFKTGAYGKYSLTWWRKEGVDRYGIYNTPESRYINSQLLLGYVFDKKTFCMPLTVYAAGILNSAAEVVPASAGKRRNFGWYAAIQFGQLKKENDLYFDVCYQDVGLQTVPAFDFSGIGRGNSTSWGDPAVIVDPFNPGNYSPSSAVLTVPANAVEGNNNYKGIEMRLKYNVTSELTLSATLDVSRQKTRAVGGTNSFRSFEGQVIYGF